MRGRESMYKNIILDKAGQQQVADSDVVGGFARIRQLLQGLARPPVFAVERGPASLGSAAKADRRMAALYDLPVWKKSTNAERQMRMRATMFDLLDAEILNAPSFGIEGAVYADPVSGKSFLLENGLVRFEAALGAGNG